MSKLILIRGIPGSGKSTLARQIVHGTVGRHLEADMYFVDPVTQKYEWDATRVRDAHEWCLDRTGLYLGHGMYPVVVSNTFTRLRELRPYFELAAQYNVIPNVITAQGGFKNVHDVPEETLKKMAARFEHDVSPLYAEFFG